MKRREFLGTLFATGSASWLDNKSEPLSKGLFDVGMPPGTDVKRVLTVYKCHFDGGFVDTQAVVIRRYFDHYFPKAIETAELLSRTGSSGYV